VLRIHSGLSEARGRLAHRTIAIGNFDGVHLGHQALLARACAGGALPCVLTFEPHPARLLAPQLAPPRIATPARKLELLEACGAQVAIVQPFELDFARLTAEAFVELLCATGASGVVVGGDFTYGRSRSGNVATLGRSLGERGLTLSVVPTVSVDGLTVSSTKLRELLLEGNAAAARSLLGRPFDLDGEVVRGAGRGRQLGFPTANVLSEAELLPAAGVYAVRMRLWSAAEGAWGPGFDGAANLGLNPTFDAVALPGRMPLSLEVHLLDRTIDLYGEKVRVEFVQRLRSERRFAGVGELTEQLRRDVEQARAALR
jgi:riboflavin kinase/FMN adenylyltransferase